MKNMTLNDDAAELGHSLFLFILLMSKEKELIQLNSTVICTHTN
jgi:hypothetical protein